ncbi:MAG: uroporphyrinogen decarboxylase, partial [Deltaproteobacteria bacterium]|nr:uroporphyrinogen decarboxylase [Deltaproteobacteria bacterium]
RACAGEKVERAPIWIMRQAGRYLPDYQKVRSKTTFLNLCKTPELASKVTLQPIDILKVDAAIIFSDILIVPEALGQKLTMEEKVGPRLFPKIQNQSGIKKLKRPTVEKAFDYLGKAIQMTRKGLPENIPLLGFAGSPWTLMAYMVEGSGSKNFETVKTLLLQNPKLAHELLSLIADTVTDLLNYQIECGVQAVQIFDSWGGVLSSDLFYEFSLDYVERVISNLNRKQVPVIFFGKGTGQHLDIIQDCGADVLSLDWTVDLGWARHVVGNKITLQGNLDPVTLFASPKKIRESVQDLFEQINPRERFIFNLGHGILPNTPPEHAKYLVKCVKELSRD